MMVCDNNTGIESQSTSIPAATVRRRRRSKMNRNTPARNGQSQVIVTALPAL